MAIPSGLRAAFFALGWIGLGQACGQELNELIDQARQHQLADTQTWHALLHLHQGQLQIQDPGFLLSAPHFSAQRELDATLRHLHGPQAREAACRFPARDTWLREQLKLPPADTAHCVDAQTFAEKAPMARVSLVFAAEVLSEPSSMMGHLFIRADGETRSGTTVSHAVSFYTDASSWNLPKLFYDTMVVGKRGHFALNPYREARERYAVQEQRTLWQYELNLTDGERRRLQAHMQELRQTSLTYFFQDYNCATLVDNLLRAARPTFPPGPGGWTTPHEVLRRAQEGGLIANVTVETPSRWRIRSIAPLLSAEQVQAVDQAVQKQDIQALQQGDTGLSAVDFLRWQLALAESSWRRETSTQVMPSGAPFRQSLREDQPRFAGLELDAQPDHQPTQAPPERQWSVGWLQRGPRQWLKLRAMPVSHRLEDDNRSYPHESELRLFEPSVLVRADRAQAQLERFTLYGVRSLLPRDAITGGLSGHFLLAWAPQASAQQPGRQAWLAEGSLGATWRLHHDVDAYALMGGGMGWRQGGYLYAQPELGLVIREVGDMKSWVRAQWLSRPLGDTQPSRQWTWTQSWAPISSWTVQAEWAHVWQGPQQAHSWQLGLTHLF